MDERIVNNCNDAFDSLITNESLNGNRLLYSVKHAFKLFQHFPFQFAFASLITLNVLMDSWICFKICVILYWALVSEND